MANRREALVMVGVGAAAAAAGWYFGPKLGPGPGAADVGALFAASLRDTDGRSFTIAKWSGKVLVCNFWATWCAPCREEIPALNRIHAKMSGSGVQIVGIAIDQAANVVEFLRTLPVAYAVVLGDSGLIDVMRRLGNTAGGLPYTVVLDRNGLVAERTLGLISESGLEHRLSTLIAAIPPRGSG